MMRIAIRMLVGDGPKYAGVLFGIAIMTWLTMLVGSMFLGMLTRTYSLVGDNPSVDIWVMDPACESLIQTINMPDTAVDRVKGVPGVAVATRLTLGSAAARLPNGKFITVDLIGVDDATLRGLPASADIGSAQAIRGPEAALFDLAGTHGQLVMPVATADRWPHGKPRLDVETRGAKVGDEFLVNNNAVRIAGEVKGRPKFLPQVALYMTYSNAAKVLPPERNRLTFVLASVQDGHDAEVVAQRIEDATGLRARTSDRFASDTAMWFVRNSEVLRNILVIVSAAAMVGFAITGLMLYMFTKENARYYATLKAIGASNLLLMRMVLAQAMIAGAMGLGLGVGACVAFGLAMNAATGFPFRVAWLTLGGVSVLVLAVTACAAVISTRSVLKVEPGTVFKN